ncbi:MAG: multidrug efflux SMR transporter [Melioribacteraceae bacterium]|nr:multidrug efflux SMR transporter [Melioribacteraceae bacterium]MCF8432247.1 multidrug efflux SMR transporter [Melioribacteraceae bacterium]
MSWIYILIAGIFEIVWAVGLKYSEGFTKLVPSLITIVTMILTYVFLSLGLKNIPLGTGYAVWTGIGVIGTTIYGMIYFNESTEILRIVFISLIFIGIIGLRFTTTT